MRYLATFQDGCNAPTELIPAVFWLFPVRYFESSLEIPPGAPPGRLFQCRVDARGAFDKSLDIYIAKPGQIPLSAKIWPKYAYLRSFRALLNGSPNGRCGAHQRAGRRKTTLSTSIEVPVAGAVDHLSSAFMRHRSERRGHRILYPLD
jgi:hypothetical protein